MHLALLKTDRITDTLKFNKTLLGIAEDEKQDVDLRIFAIYMARAMKECGEGDAEEVEGILKKDRENRLTSEKEKGKIGAEEKPVGKSAIKTDKAEEENSKGEDVEKLVSGVEEMAFAVSDENTKPKDEELKM